MKNYCGFGHSQIIKPPYWALFTANCEMCDICYNGSMDTKYTLVKNIDSKKGLYNCSGCNKNYIRYHSNIKTGKSKSCQKCGSGNYSLPKEIAHLYKTKIYNVWDSMVGRSNNKNHRDYQKYGGVGRKLETESWLKFENFAKDMYSSYKEAFNIYGKKNISLDRINNDKGYSKRNCRWTNQSTQMRNMSRNRLLTVKGITKCLQEWAEEYGIKYQTIQTRLKCGWSTEDAITKKVNELKQKNSNTKIRYITKTKKGYYIFRKNNKYIKSFKSLEDAINFKNTYER